MPTCALPAAICCTTTELPSVASRRRQVKVQLGAALRHGMPAKYLIEGRVAKALFISWTAADRWGMVSPCAHVGSASGEPARWTVPAASCARGSYGSPPTRWRPTPSTWRSSRAGSSSGGPGGGVGLRPHAPSGPAQGADPGRHRPGHRLRARRGPAVRLLRHDAEPEHGRLPGPDRARGAALPLTPEKVLEAIDRARRMQ